MHPDKEVFHRNSNVIVLENGLNPKTNDIVIEEANSFKNVFAAIGLHPTDVAKMNKEEVRKALDYIENKLQDKYEKILAIGEVGLDYYWIKEESLREKERRAFRGIIEIANEYEVPLIVHTRSAERDIEEFVKVSEVPFILHSYTGRKSIAKKLLEYDNVYFSIPAIIYRRDDLKSLVKIIPVERILTETDSPFLSPIKGQRNEPKNIIYGIKAIAEVKEIEAQELEEKIFRNFKALYRVSYL